ncbi:MAG: O-methyltransferase [Candidatus Kapabacteria bacterium]|jgi:predicted O-methyltransferase YrrM|nr:O-methyltransferase [Candidatus Kapabacteria bacterium]
MKYVPLTEALHSYICETFPAEDEFLCRLKTEADEAGLPPIHIAPEQIAFLQVLMRSVGARRVLEIGTLAGYSAIAIARALPNDGRLLTLERNPLHAEFALRKIREAALEHVIEVRTGSAKELLGEIREEPFDAVFIDADKAGYGTYLQKALPLLRLGGLVIGDNTLAWGNIADATTEDKTVQALRRFNTAMSAHPQLQSCLVPIAEGMTIGVKIR